MNPAPTEPRRNLTGAVIPALAAAGLAGLGAMYLVTREPAQIAVPAGCILENADAIGGPIELVNTRGQTMTQADFAGQPAVVFFGFTHCPDVCPTTMYDLNQALALPGGYDVQPVFVTVDPARDTPEVLGQYLATDGFPQGVVGLTGSQAQVDAAARAFHVSYSRGEARNDGNYNVNHTTFLYVLDSQWRTVAAIPTFRPGEAQSNGQMSPMVPVEPQDLAACIGAGLDRGAPAQP